jgi:NAD(P)-dependent dehydrogenase (short-subunit alcohol dehydrogenase family)
MNIIITGASRGIGFEMARIFAKDIKNQIVVISRDFEKLKELQKICLEESANPNVQPVAFDLVKDDIDKLIPGIISKSGPVDILINNAGLLINKAFTDLDGNDFDQMFSVNVKGPFILSKNLIKHFNKGAHIVNISSMGGYQGSVKFPGLSLYSASKAALAVLTECMAEELKDKGISVNCLALGAAQTEMLEVAFPSYKAPLSAAEMAEYICDFARNGHKYMNGKIIPVSLTSP